MPFGHAICRCVHASKLRYSLRFFLFLTSYPIFGRGLQIVHDLLETYLVLLKFVVMKPPFSLYPTILTLLWLMVVSYADNS